MDKLLVFTLYLLLASIAPAQESEKSDLRCLLRALADEAFDNLVIQDPARRVFGMAYEFKQMPDGPLIQDFGLDSMHDGAWLMSAMVTAHRIDPNGGYLDRVQNLQAPFYINLLKHSDRLFPNMIPREGQEKFTKPIKGWAPRGWDDGPGIDLVTVLKHNKPQPFSAGVISHPNGTVIERDAQGSFQHAYFTSSHHLFQDLADSLLNVWLTTRDPGATEAIRLIDQGRIDHGIQIPVVRTATGLVSGDETLSRRRPPSFDPARAFRPIWQGVVKKSEIRFGHYNDGLAWDLRAEFARKALSGKPIPDGFVLNTAAQVFSAARLSRAVFRDSWKPGTPLPSHLVAFKDGKLTSHADANTPYGSRGMQFAWIGAAILPEFRQRGDAWDQAVASLSKDERQSIQDFTGVNLSHADVVAELETYVDASIRHWQSVRNDLGFLPRMVKANRRSFSWSRWMELGAYAHLMKLTAFRLIDLEGKKEPQLIQIQTPDKPLPSATLPAFVLKIQGLEQPAK